MNVDNALSREFLLNYPVEAARVLEQVSADDVAALLMVLPVDTGIAVLTFMLPDMAADCLARMTTTTAVTYFNELPVSTTARIYRLLEPAKQNELHERLSEKVRSRLERHLLYPSSSVGAMLDPLMDVLPENISVAEALHRIDRLQHPASCEIYVVDDTQRLVGMIDLGNLLAARHHARLRDVISHKTQAVSVHASAESLLTHPGWEARRRLPVVERDNSLIGVLDHRRLQDTIGETAITGKHDPLDNLLSLMGLYWLSMAQVLDSLLPIARSRKEGSHD
jgi:magnesium transporter